MICRNTHHNIQTASCWTHSSDILRGEKSQGTLGLAVLVFPLVVESCPANVHLLRIVNSPVPVEEVVARAVPEREVVVGGLHLRDEDVGGAHRDHAHVVVAHLEVLVPHYTSHSLTAAPVSPTHPALVLLSAAAQQAVTPHLAVVF